MKKTLKRLLLAALLMVPWATRAQDCTQTVPFSENFESYAGVAYNATTGRILPTCWTGFSSSTSTSNTFMPTVVAGTGSYVYYHGAKSLAMTGGTNTSHGMNKYVLLPPMNVPLNQLQISFWMCTESNLASYGTLHLGYVTSDDTSTFVSIASYTSSAATYHSGNGVQAAGVGLNVEAMLSQVPTTATRLAFKWEHSNSSYHTCCIDDIVVDYLPSCPKVENLAAMPTSDGAVLSWTEMGTATNWEVTVSDANGPVYSDIVSSNPYTLTNLTANSDYNVSLRAVCGTGDTSLVRSTSFRTLCTAIASSDLPWQYGFEDATASGSAATFNSCLGRHTNYSSTAYPYASNTYKHSGSYALYGYSTSSYYSYLTLVPFEDNIEDLFLTFWAYKTSANYGHVFVGVMSNPDDLSTFDTIATLQVNEVSRWQLFEVPLSTYSGNGGVLTLLVPQMSAANYVYIDDIAVGYPPTCSTPTDIVDSNATASTVDLSWTSSAQEFIVEYGLHGFEMGTGTIVSAYTNSITLTDLTMGAEYDVYVTAVCGSDTSNVAIGSFAAGCRTLTENDLPYTEDFETYGNGSAYAINHCWTKGTNNSTAYPYPSSTAINGNRSLYMYGYNASSGTDYYSWVALPQMDENVNMSDLMLNFTAKRYSTTSNYYTSLYYVGIADSLSGFTSAEAIDTLVTWIDTIDLFDEAGNSIHQIETSFESYTGNGHYVVIYAPVPELHGSATYCYNYAYIDDITLRRIPTCYWPTEVSLVSVTTEEAELSWVPDERTPNPNSWTLEYDVHGFTPGEGLTETTTDTTFTLYGLLPNTEYDVYISADCGGGDVSDPVMFTFRTLCTALDSLPLTIDFEDAATGTSTSEEFVNCMFRLNNGTTYFGYPYVSSTATYNHTAGGTKGLYWLNSSTTGTYGDYQIVVMPGVDTNVYTINTLQLRFWARSSSTSYSPTFQVGVMTDPFDATTFQTVATVNIGSSTTFSEFTTVLSGFEGYGNYVAIRALRPGSSWTAYVDDITLEEMPLCPGVNNIEAIASVGGALLTWNYQDGYEAPTTYEIVYDSIGGDSPTTLTSNESSINISGLELGATYKAYVYADCGGDGLGAMDSVTFTTKSLGCLEIDTNSLDTVIFSNSTSGNTGCLAYSSYGNTVYQTIYTASELTAQGLTAGPITGIDLGFTACTTYNKEFTIFIGNTSTTSISDATIEDPNQQQQVYGPALHPMNTSGWQHYDFTTPFEWDGSSSIIITTFMNQTGGSQSNSTGLTGYYVSASNRARCHYKDSNPFTLQDYNSGTSYSSYDKRAAIKFYTAGCAANATCAAPSASVVNVTASSVDIAWAPGYDETSWNIDYRLAGDSNWTSAATGESNTSYTLNGLMDATEYDIRVWFVCSGDNDLVYESIVRATTLCAPKTLPYTEDFDNLTTGTATSNLTVMPLCWDYILTGTSTYQGATYRPGIYYSANYAASGNYCLRLYGIGDYALPEMATSLDSLRLTFTDTTTSANYGLIVGIMENGVFMPYDTIDLTLGTRNYIEVTFNNYSGTSRTIALRNYHTTSSTTYYSYHYIDDIVVDYIPVCAHVENLAVVEMSDTSATINWQPVNGETSWVVAYDTVSFVTIDTVVTLNGLTPNTFYNIEVRSICGVGDTSEAALLQMTTECGKLNTLPYVEDFENASTGSSSNSNFVNCWTRINNGTTYFGYPYVSGTSTYNHTLGGTKGLYWYGSTTATTYGDYQIIVLPRIDTTALPINTLQLDFWARSSSTSYNPVFEVGVMDSLSNSNFVPIDTININGITSWENYVVSLGSYTASGAQYVAIRAQRPTSNWYAYVDDITLDRLPLCPRVEDITVNVGLNTAIVSWTDTSSNAGWNVEYDSVEFTPGTGHMTPLHVTDTTCALSGLDSATTYYVYVYPDCNNDVFARQSSFTTLAASPATVPYTCGFEANGANGWDLYNGSQANHWMVGNGTNNGGSQALYITNDDSTNAYTITTISYVFASRTFDLAAGDYVFSYDWKANGESSYDFIRAALVPANTVLTPGDYSGFNNTSDMPAGGIALDGGNRLNLQSDWQTQIGEFALTTAGTYKMVFMWRNDGSGGTQPPAAIDNINLRINTCPIVSDVTANVGSSTIDLTWTAGGNESSWLVTVGGNSTVVNTTSYTATNLVADTDYVVSIVAICAANDSSMAYTETFHTTCQAVSLPYSENFDSYTTSTTAATGQIVPCWNNVLTGSSTYQTGTYVPQIYYSSSYASSGSYSYRLYGIGYHMLPPMSAPLDSLQLTFSDYTTSTSYGLEVGVMEGNNFIPIQTITTPSSTHLQHTVYFGSYTGNSRIIAFRNYYTSSTTTYYSYHYLDDIVVDYLPACAPVVNVNAAAAGIDYITVDWVDQTSNAQMWEVEYSNAGTTNTVTATSHPVTLSNLDTLTTYSVRVRPICSATDTGMWSQAAILNTELCDNALAISTGAATSTASTTPTNNIYKYTLTETIIDSAEMAGSGDISAIAFSYNYTTAMTKKTDVTIWMQHTDKTVFSSSTDYVALDTVNAVKVYEGSLNCVQGWNYFVFPDTANFTWDGHSNVMVIVDDNSNQYDGSSYHYQTSACNGYKTIALYSDTQNPDPANPSAVTTNKNYYQYRATMKLISCGASCAAPTALSFSDIDYGTATATWSGNATSYEVSVKTASEPTWPDDVLVSTNTYTANGLTPNTTYQFRVRAICDATEGLISNYTIGTFTTDSLPCFVPTELHTTAVNYTNATLAWTAGGAETEWNLHVWNSTFDTILTASDSTLTVTGLAQTTQYNAAVKAICGGGYAESEYGDTIQFTTTTCPQVEGVTVSDITANSATVTWTDASGVSSYILEYGNAGFQQGQGTPVTVNNATTYTLTGLESEKSYSVFVRAVCAEDATGAWSSRVNFVTLEGGQTGINGADGANLSIYPNPTTSTTTIALSGVSGSVSVNIVDMNGRVVMSDTMSCEGDCAKTMEVSGLAQGAYFVRISGDNVNMVKKLVVK